MTWLWVILSWALLIYLLLLFIRAAYGWMQILNRDWRPSGFALWIGEIAFTVTDPPIKAVRKVLPSLRIGPIALDLSFMAVFLLCTVLIQVVAILAR